jgi:type III pantothenate kinase
MGKRILVLDAGNSRIKWGLAEASEWVDSGVAVNNMQGQLVSAWNRLPDPDRIMGSNVAGESQIAAIAKYWHKRGIGVTWIQSSAESCGVVNNYEQPNQLGSDRWAALIGAWSKVRRTCLVVSAGTALTIDMLDDQGNFVGGRILPGKRLMHECLISGTHALHDETGQVKDYPLNTADAMATGIANAHVSSIESAFRLLETQAVNKPVCLITGGDSDWLVRQLRIPSIVEPGLVLDGVLKIAEEENRS